MLELLFLKQGVILNKNAFLNHLYTGMEEPEMKKNLSDQGMVQTGGTPQKFGERIQKDYQRWTRVVKEANIKAE